jgi:hypothetical protein
MSFTIKTVSIALCLGMLTAPIYSVNKITVGLQAVTIIVGAYLYASQPPNWPKILEGLCIFNNAPTTRVSNATWQDKINSSGNTSGQFTVIKPFGEWFSRPRGWQTSGNTTIPINTLHEARIGYTMTTTSLTATYHWNAQIHPITH